MIKQLYLFIIFFTLPISIKGCDWCLDAKTDKQQSFSHLFVNNYFRFIQPSIKDLAAIQETMCVDAYTTALKIQIELLAHTPSKYFHIKEKGRFTEHHLRKSVEASDQIIQFIHSHMVDKKTKAIKPYSYDNKNKNLVFLSEYLAQNSPKDAYGCTLLHDIYAYSLSYSGTFFNSILLKSRQNSLHEKEMRSLVLLFHTIDFLAGQLRNTPYQASSEKNIKLWTRLFKTIEKEWENKKKGKTSR
ncbi:hypothetical protein JKY79_03480 [Candidatus Babeliales bacterium]|nr:hypothetical protein [Candidatus Babeliales bacterium]